MTEPGITGCCGLPSPSTYINYSGGGVVRTERLTASWQANCHLRRIDIFKWRSGRRIAQLPNEKKNQCRVNKRNMHKWKVSSFHPPFLPSLLPSLSSSFPLFYPLSSFLSFYLPPTSLLFSPFLPS